LSAELYYEEHVIGLVGPGCTFALEPVARLASYWNIPIVTGMQTRERKRRLDR
jgi:atrial natriuretic peptide receptor A